MNDFTPSTIATSTGPCVEDINYGKFVRTFLYCLAFLILLSLTLLVVFNPVVLYDTSNIGALLEFLMINLISLLVLSFLATIAALRDKKTLLKTFTTLFILASLTSLFSVWGDLTSKLMFLALTTGVMVFASVAGLALKAVYSVQSSTTKTIALITPFLLMLVLFMGTLFNALGIEEKDCSSLTDVYQKDDCFLAVAKKTTDLNVCMSIDSASFYEDQETGKTGTTKAHCIEAVITQLDQQGILIPQTCASLTSADAKSVCYNRVAVKSEDSSLCENVQLTYGKNAFEKNDISLPGGVFDDVRGATQLLDRDSCYLSIWSLNKKTDETLCVKVANVENRQWCYYITAITANDPALCEVVESDSTNSCYIQVAGNTGDIAICNLINTPESLNNNAMEVCYAGVAIHNQDGSLCERVKEMSDVKYAEIKARNINTKPDVMQGLKDTVYMSYSRCIEETAASSIP